MILRVVYLLETISLHMELCVPLIIDRRQDIFDHILIHMGSYILLKKSI